MERDLWIPKLLPSGSWLMRIQRANPGVRTMEGEPQKMIPAEQHCDLITKGLNDQDAKKPKPRGLICIGPYFMYKTLGLEPELNSIRG